MTKRWYGRGAAALLLAMGIALTPALADGKIVVKVGETADAMKAAKGHDLTPAALNTVKEKGSGEFWVKDGQGNSHAFQLDAKQASDLLAGTTVMVDTKGDEKSKPVHVTIEMSQEKADKPSGW